RRLSAESEQNGAGIREDDDASGGDCEDPGGQELDQLRGKRCGDDAADEECCDDGPFDALRTEGDEEAQRPADGDEELARVDRADDLARLQTTGRQQRRGADRTPATAADGVE